MRHIADMELLCNHLKYRSIIILEIPSVILSVRQNIILLRHGISLHVDVTVAEESILDNQARNQPSGSR